MVFYLGQNGESQYYPAEDIGCDDEQSDVSMTKEVTICRCPYCGGQAYLLGSLGKLEWYRCQDCGIEFNKSK
jgi:DNA-directed RNA polymerase subunit RPC12/RpoP